MNIRLIKSQLKTLFRLKRKIEEKYGKYEEKMGIRDEIYRIFPYYQTMIDLFSKLELPIQKATGFICTVCGDYIQKVEQNKLQLHNNKMFHYNALTQGICGEMVPTNEKRIYDEFINNREFKRELLNSWRQLLKEDDIL